MVEEEDLPPMFREVACKRFAELQCQDLDLLHISRMIAREGNSLASVGACLLIGREVISPIEKDESCPKVNDKIHKVLSEWQWKNTSNATWARLIKSLEVLDDQNLMEHIRKYLSQKEYPVKAPQLSGEQVAMQETASATATALTSSMSTNSNGPLIFTCNPHSENTPGSPTANFDIPSSAELSPLSLGSPSVLVSGKSSASEASAAAVCIPDVPVNAEVRRKTKLMEESFAGLLVTASAELGKLGVPVDEVVLYLTSLKVSTQADEPLFDKYTLSLLNESSLNKIFTILCRTGAINFLNYRLLQLVMIKFGDQNLKDQVEKYGEEVNQFMKETEFTDFYRIWSGQAAHGSVPYGQLVVVKLDRKWPGATLSMIADMEKFLAGEFQLNAFIFHFSQANPGCVSLVWLIPACAARLIKEAMKTKQSDFKRMNIQELIVNGEVLFSARIPLSLRNYSALYQRSIECPDQFWCELAHKYLQWRQPFKTVMQCNMAEGDIKWFLQGKLNVSVNCLDRHAEKDPHRVALIWEKDEPNQQEKVTYSELLGMTCRVANVLKRLGVKKHGTVLIYMPAFPLAVASMLACARIGAVHSVVFSGLHAIDLKKRINDANAKIVITANEGVVGGQHLPLKATVDSAVKDTAVEVVLVAARTQTEVTMIPGRDLFLDEEMSKAEATCPPEEMDSEDPLFIIYTSRTSQRSKGVVHTQAGYLLYAAVTHQCVFDYQPGDVFACIADLSWITGHSYVVYGPLCNGATTVLFESTATYPHAGRYWDMVDRLQVNQFFTVPSAIRLLMKVGDELVTKYSLSSLKTIASTGEPLNETAWKWYNEKVGKGRCHVVDAWWQTETGGIAVTPLLESEIKPGFIMKPFFGVEPVLMDDNASVKSGRQIHCNNTQGFLCLKKPLPGMARTFTGSQPQERFRDAYFRQYPGFYYTADLAHRDAAGDYKLIGRKDDAIRTPSAWLSVTEIENVMYGYNSMAVNNQSIARNMSDDRVLETSFVGCRQENGDSHERMSTYKTFAFVEVREEVSEAESRNVFDNVKRAFQVNVTDEIAKPERFIFVKNQPKTYSGKIMKHILRHAATKFAKLKPGEETAQEALYKDELQEIFEDFHYNQVGEENPQMHFDPLACY